MWFKFPEGTESITVQQQTYGVEATNKETGENFFRAPDHFAPIILDLPGFSRGIPPEGSPEDLPKEDPTRSSSIDQLSAQVDSFRAEVDNLKAANSRLSTERDALQLELDEAKKTITELEDEEDDKRAARRSTRKKGT